MGPRLRRVYSIVGFRRVQVQAHAMTVGPISKSWNGVHKHDLMFQLYDSDVQYLKQWILKGIHVCTWSFGEDVRDTGMGQVGTVAK